MKHHLRFTFLASIPVLLLITGQGWAHGVRGTSQICEVICVTASYDDGEPMSYAAVEIKAPDSKLPFQSGRSDRNGLFCFNPDTPGPWQINVSDGMGHLVRLKSQVGQDLALQPAKVDPDPGNKALKVTSGLSLLFGLAGSIAWWQSSRKRLKS